MTRHSPHSESTPLPRRGLVNQAIKDPGNCRFCSNKPDLPSKELLDFVVKHCATMSCLNSVGSIGCWNRDWHSWRKEGLPSVQTTGWSCIYPMSQYVTMWINRHAKLMRAIDVYTNSHKTLIERSSEVIFNIQTLNREVDASWHQFLIKRSD